MDFALDALSVYRITRLVTQDRLTEPFRDAVERRNRTLGYLVACSHCTGFWAALSVACVSRAVPRLWRPVSYALALSAVTSLLEDYG